MRIPFLFAALYVLCAPAHAGTETGLPLPRFASLKAEEVNARTGPGDRYPIEWVYRRQRYPVEIIEEFEHWRKIRDVEGSEAWVHKSMLSGQRTALFPQAATIARRRPEPDAPPAFKAESGVVAKITECRPGWCQLEVGGLKGWVEKTNFWGTYASEVFD